MLKKIEPTRKKNKKVDEIIALKIKLIEAELKRQREEGTENEKSLKLFVDSLDKIIENQKVDTWQNLDIPLESKYLENLCKKFPIITDNHDLYLEAKEHSQRKIIESSSLRIPFE